MSVVRRGKRKGGKYTAARKAKREKLSIMVVKGEGE